MGHLRSFGLNNFRVFNSETDFELRPITILTGTNSSGKSSFIKGLQVMKLAFSAKKPFLDSLNEINLNEVKNLGGFDLLKNRDNDSPTISFKLPFMLPNQFNQMVLKLNYTSNGRTLKNAELASLVVTDKEEKIVLYDISFDKSNWNLKINFSELYQYLRDFKEIESKFEILEKSLYKDTGMYSDSDRSDNYEEVLEQLAVISPELAICRKYNTIEIDSFNELFLGFKSTNIPFATSIFLFPFVFLYKSEYTEEYINRCLTEDEIIILMDLKNTISRMNTEELKEFSKEFVEAEKKLLQLMECNYRSWLGGRIPALGVFDMMSPNTIMTEFYKLAGKDLQSMLNKEKQQFEEEFFPKATLPIDLVKDSHDFFIKNDINGNFLMLSTKNSEIFEKNFNSFFKLFCNKGFEEAIETTKLSFQSMEFIPSIRSQSGRVFHYDASNYLNQILLEFYKTKSDGNTYSIRFLNQYVKEFKIADKVAIVPNNDSSTSSIHFIKNEQKINIADLGYGISQLLPILIRIAININICNFHFEMTDDMIYSGGVPPVFGTYPSILVIEEPETNLHPALQSKLADLFVECYKKYNIQFVIETHSEYFIRKLQYKIAKEEFSQKDANIYYFNDPESEAYKTEVVYKIDIERNGILSRPFGSGFFDESNNLNMSLYLLTKDSLN